MLKTSLWKVCKICLTRGSWKWKKTNNFQCLALPSPHLHPLSSFLDFFLTGVATPVILCGSMSSCWQQRAFFWELLPPRRLCSNGSQGWPAGVLLTSALPSVTGQASPEGQGKGQEVRKGTGRRGNRRLGGEKLNKQGSRCLNSFWLLSGAAVYLERWGMLNFPQTPSGWWLCSDRRLHPLL